MVGPEWAYRPVEIGVTAGVRLDLSAPFFTNDVKTVGVGADMVHITVDGHGRLTDGEIDTTVLEDVWYCMKGHQCESTCPGEGPAVVFRGTINDRFLLALAGGLDGTIATIEAQKFADECETPKPTAEPTDSEFCRRYRDYVAWAEALGPDADVTQALAREIATRFEGMWPVTPPELKQWVKLVFVIYAKFAGIKEPYSIPVTGHVSGIEHLPEALQAMHAYCGIPWPAT